MNESTTRPDCPVGPDERPTLVTWCDGCGAAGIRSAADLLDELCRYCGGDVKRRRFPSRHAATRFIARGRRQHATAQNQPGGAKGTRA